MNKNSATKRVQDIQPAPVVSTDSTSEESILARNAKTIQLQAASDSKFDTVLERFSNSERYYEETIFPFFSLSVAFFLLCIATFGLKK